MRPEASRFVGEQCRLDTRLTKSRRHPAGFARGGEQISKADPQENRMPKAAPCGVTRTVIGQESAEAIVPVRAGQGRAEPQRTGRSHDGLETDE